MGVRQLLGDEVDREAGREQGARLLVPEDPVALGLRQGERVLEFVRRVLGSSHPREDEAALVGDLDADRVRPVQGVLGAAGAVELFERCLEITTRQRHAAEQDARLRAAQWAEGRRREDLLLIDERGDRARLLDPTEPELQTTRADEGGHRARMVGTEPLLEDVPLTLDPLERPLGIAERGVDLGQRGIVVRDHQAVDPPDRLTGSQVLLHQGARLVQGAALDLDRRQGGLGLEAVGMGLGQGGREAGQRLARPLLGLAEATGLFEVRRQDLGAVPHVEVGRGIQPVPHLERQRAALDGLGEARLGALEQRQVQQGLRPLVVVG